MPGLKGVCNGILRNLVRKKDELAKPDAEKEPVKAAALKYSVPEWIYKRIYDDYGAEAQKILAFRNHDEGWMLRPNLMKLDDAGFERLLDKKVWKKGKTDLPHAWRITGAMDIARDADYLSGNYSIQSAGSMLACLAMNVKRGQQILDCCAAPGGKSILASEFTGDTGSVTSCDISEEKADLIRDNFERLGCKNTNVIVKDASVNDPSFNEGYDTVILDVPCSGLGIMGKKRDIKYNLTEEGLESLTGLQRKIIDSCVPYVKKGGKLIVVSPTERHLFGLKTVLYNEPYENKPNRYGLRSFTLTDEKRLEYSITLETDKQAANLFAMTPYYYKSSPEAKARLNGCAPLTTEVGFLLQTYTVNDM
jgi:16S rRNA (cytosine967-C5)-methyltransferase